MIRMVLVTVALLLVPFVVYGIFELLRQGPDGKGPRNPKDWEEKALLRLGFTGLALSALGIAAVIATQGSSGTGEYVPARIENGKLIDGGFNPPDGAPERSDATE